MSQIPSAASNRARRARDRYKTCPHCPNQDVDGIHVDQCEEKQRYLDVSRSHGGEAGIPQVTTDDLHAHVISRCHNEYVAALVVQVVIDLGWRPVVGSDPTRLYRPGMRPGGDA